MTLSEIYKGIWSSKNISPDQSNAKCGSPYPWQLWAVRTMEYFSGQSKARLILSSLSTLGLLGMMDRAVGNPLFTCMLCFIPILLATWFGGIWTGIMTSVAGTLVILSTEIVTGSSASYSDTGVRLGSFIVLSVVLSALKSSVEHEREFGRVDFLTGISNRRSFTESAEMEIHRARRYDHPFTVIYIDLDDFKMVNDRFGHARGDKLLRSLAQALYQKIRTTDLVARLGGDEFGILLPETGPEVAELIVRRLQDVGMTLMQKKGWPIPFSMGVVTFLEPPASVDEMLVTSDTVMYAAKKNGKRGICRETFPKSELPAKLIVGQSRLLQQGDMAVQEFQSTSAEPPGV